jgi:hypothetical protein
MNIFVLHTDPDIAARMHCDKHVPKMCVEAAQMMASALRRHGATDEDMPLTKAGTPYKGGYAHHPCTIFAGDSRDNFKWLARHAMALLREYDLRFDKMHACHLPIQMMSCKDYIIPEGGLTQFALAMPDEYRPEPIHGEIVYHAYAEHAVQAYRRYYHSKQFAKWEKGRPAPDWWQGVEVTA